MISSAQRLLTLVVLGFALMGFIAVPLFGKTGFEHVRDFLQSQDAAQAGEEVTREFTAMQDHLEAELAERGSRNDASNDERPTLSRKEERLQLSESPTE